MKLFLDDERFPVDDSHIVRNMKEFCDFVKTNGFPNFISFDHDLGDHEPTGYDIVKWFIDEALDGNIIIPDDFSYYVHSQNPIIHMFVPPSRTRDMTSNAWLALTARPEPNTFEWYVHNLSKFEDAMLHYEVHQHTDFITFEQKYYSFPRFSDKNVSSPNATITFGEHNHSALTLTGTKFMEIKMHRYDGPAYIKSDGTRIWFFKGKQVAVNYYYGTNDRRDRWLGPLSDWATENGINLSNPSEDDVSLIKLSWM